MATNMANERPKLKKRKHADHARNPWSAEGWNSELQAKIVANLGPRAAAGIAASVGCLLTSKEPNRECAS
jgi:hypothetical protein